MKTERVGGLGIVNPLWGQIWIPEALAALLRPFGAEQGLDRSGLGPLGRRDAGKWVVRNVPSVKSMEGS
jgi:hypothetical protein